MFAVRLSDEMIFTLNPKGQARLLCSHQCLCEGLLRFVSDRILQNVLVPMGGAVRLQRPSNPGRSLSKWNTVCGTSDMTILRWWEV